MLIDDFMPRWDMAKQYEIEVAATPATTLAAAKQMDPSRDRVVGTLLRMRGYRQPPRAWTGLSEAGFVLLGESETELLAGIVGRFWTVRGGLRPVAPADFVAFEEPDHAKATWNFTVEAVGADSSLLKTETRVATTDRGARHKFQVYWSIVGPFSGLIRRRALQGIKAVAESK